MGTGGWSMRCQHLTPTSFRAMEEDAFPTFDVLEQRWTEEERTMRDELARLSDDDLTDYVRYTTPEGEKRERLLWHCLVHVVNHRGMDEVRCWWYHNLTTSDSVARGAH